MRVFILFLFLSLVFVSCSIQKRVYRNGFYVENSRNNPDKTQANKPIGIPLAKTANSITSNTDSVAGIYHHDDSIPVIAKSSPACMDRNFAPADTFIVTDDKTQLSRRKRIQSLLKHRSKEYGSELIREADIANTLLLIGFSFFLLSITWILFPIALIYNVIAYMKYEREPERYDPDNLLLIRRTFLIAGIFMVIPFLLTALIVLLLF